ncbi:uncharacterized protein BDW43DRAFT_95958 [Aspergillus alliaceus]|uniref:uncharacterized protein n=1 Tax=Petromyces alliaceus TaxID=209559 RepID=UPI0012A54FC1|nr:uncharacterized protein BDW43DRAFT_95958 [Aspergillus alliaceus]KAB8233161.1 hypothetical protein BDW43DRAFT_95958 [Aspergillus alliaceus]
MRNAQVDLVWGGVKHLAWDEKAGKVYIVNFEGSSLAEPCPWDYIIWTERALVLPPQDLALGEMKSFGLPIVGRRH